MKIDFAKFTGALPYASELYGVYQPLLGWKSRLMTRRFEAGLNAVRRQFLAEFVPNLRPATEILSQSLHPREVKFNISLAREVQPASPLLADATDSLVARYTLKAIEDAGIKKPAVWKKFTNPDALAKTLAAIGDDVRREYETGLVRVEQLQGNDARDTRQRALLNTLLARESVAAGVLGFLHGQDDPAQMMELFLPTSSSGPLAERVDSLKALVNLIDPRQSALAKAAISPIGVVHLFRQYFFEFDTFLGPPVEHLWLSPGGTVELIEVSTRRTLVERAVETSLESTVRSERETALEDELSDAVRRENAANTKFGVSLNTTTSFSAASIFTSQVSTGTSFELNDSQKESREQLHKGLRRQSEKVASELKRSFKSSFKTVTEISDTRSRRYVIQNNTKNLMNYELRRKMRQVGVQVQDYGTHLCWQTYVDKPGDQLGVADLVHIAVPGDMPPIQQPDLPPDPVPYKGDTIRTNFRWPLEDDITLGLTGQLNPVFFADLLVGKFPISPIAGFRFDRAIVVVASGEKFTFLAKGVDDRPVASGQKETTATSIEVFHPLGDTSDGSKRQPMLGDAHPEFVLEITPEFVPSEWLIAKVGDAKEAKIKDATQRQQREFKEKLFAGIKERVRMASSIQPRQFEDLREEERIVVYRDLIRQLMSDTGVETGEPRVQHIFAELIQSMFDVDKMLYFVAPEWWMPRTIHSHPDVFMPEVGAADFSASSTISWGGGKGQRKDNYYITDDSVPAKLGSSLGWIIQLDGDDMRNAFLNAPWVKAVIPIREWKEERAIEWLSDSQVEGSDGLESEYQPGSADELPRIREALGYGKAHTVTIRDAILYLIRRVQQTHAASVEKARDKNGVKLDYLPPDKVYEHGFYPLQGGFTAQGTGPFEIFDQWIEIVPTDQIAPVEVEYDPKTGMQR
jgi:hypothetical protein